MYMTVIGNDPEVAWQSAISTLLNHYRGTEGFPVLSLYLWDAIPTSITFPAGRQTVDSALAKRTSNKSSNVLRSGKQTNTAFKPSSIQGDYTSTLSLPC